MSSPQTPLRGVSIVIPVWGQPEHVSNLVTDLIATKPSARIIWVDNANKDGTAEILRKPCKKHKWTLIENKENLGFTAAVNQGIVEAGTDDVVLMNTDIRLGPVTKGMLSYDVEWLDKLRDIADEDVAVIIPRLRDLRGGLNTTHSYIDLHHTGFPLPAWDNDLNQYNSVEEIETGTFAVAYLTREGIGRVGLLEESCVVYCSDSLYCLYARAVGMRIMRAGNVTLTHAVGSSLQNPEFNYNAALKHDTDQFRSCSPLVRTFYSAVNVTGPAGYQTGYARLMYNTGRAFRKCGIKVSMVPTALAECPQPLEPALFGELIRTPVDQNAPTIFFGTPDFARNWTKGRKVIATMLEVTGIPQEWVTVMNQIDTVWTYSQFNVRSFRESKVYAPIHVVPPCLDTDIFNPAIVPMKFSQGREFKVGAVFEFGERKWPEWIMHLLEAMRGITDASLHLRIGEGNGGVNPFLAACAGAPWNRTPVQRILQEIPEGEMGSYYRGLDLFVSVGCEGIGMPALEAMACGVPVIGLGWGPGGEYVQPDRAITIPDIGEIDAEARCPYYKGFKWGYPNWSAFQRGVFWAYNNMPALKEHAAKTAEYVGAEYNLKHVGGRYIEALGL